MSLDSRPVLPRPSADPENLRRLREQAYARVQQEEQAASPGFATRRGAIQRFALLAAGWTAGVGALLRPQSAAASVGARCSAPQYGAPPYPAPRTPYVAPAPTPAAAGPTGRWHDGNWWRDKSHTYKEGYIAGYRDGGHSTTAAGHVAPLEQDIDGLNKFYDDFRNRNIHIDDAVRYVRDELSGVPDDQLHASLLRMRQIASTGGDQ